MDKCDLFYNYECKKCMYWNEDGCLDCTFNTGCQDCENKKCPKSSAYTNPEEIITFTVKGELIEILCALSNKLDEGKIRLIDIKRGL